MKALSMKKAECLLDPPVQVLSHSLGSLICSYFRHNPLRFVCHLDNAKACALRYLTSTTVQKLGIILCPRQGYFIRCMCLGRTYLLQQLQCCQNRMAVVQPWLHALV